MASIREVVENLSTREGVQSVILLSKDGLIIDSVAASNHDADGLAALLPSVTRACGELGKAAGHGNFASSVVEFGDGYLVVTELNTDAMLALLISPNANIGPLLFDLRRHRPALAELV